MFKLSIVKFVVVRRVPLDPLGAPRVTLVRVASGLGLSGMVSLAAAAPIVARALDTHLASLWHAIRPASYAALAAVGGMYLLSNFAMGDIETHARAGRHHLLGPLVPLILMGVLAAVGCAIFAATAELVERGSVRALIRQGRWRSAARSPSGPHRQPTPAPGA